VLLDNTLSTRAKSPLAGILFRRTISQLFNRNSTTPEIIKQAAERKKIQHRRGVLRIVPLAVRITDAMSSARQKAMMLELEES
jgi:hypothetical protein